MFFEYLAQNITYTIIVCSAIALCIVGSVVKFVILKKLKNKKENKVEENCESEQAELNSENLSEENSNNPTE